MSKKISLDTCFVPTNVHPKVASSKNAARSNFGCVISFGFQSTGPSLCRSLYAWCSLTTCKATIDLEPKVRTAEENLILLPEKKAIVSVCTTNVRSHLCLFISRNHLLQQCLVLDFFPGIVTEDVFSFAYLMNQLNAKTSLQNQLSKES